MKHSKLYTSLIYCYSFLTFIIFILMINCKLYINHVYFGYLPEKTTFICLSVFVFLYTINLIESVIANRKNESWKIFKISKKKLSAEKSNRYKKYCLIFICLLLNYIFIVPFIINYSGLIGDLELLILILILILSIVFLIINKKKIKSTVLEIDSRTFLVASWILFIIVILILFSFNFSIILALIIWLVLYSSIVLLFMNIKRIYKINWTIKDCILVLCGFIISIISALVFFINLNSIGNSMISGINHIIFAPSYIEFVILPITAINIYNLIRINENNKKEKLNNN